MNHKIVLLNLPVIEKYYEDVKNPWGQAKGNMLCPDHPKTPPMGLACLAAILEREKENFLIIDAYGEGEDKLIDKDGKKFVWRGYSFDKILGCIKEAKPDIVCISCNFTLQHFILIEVIKLIKGYDKNIKIIIGGSHATFCYDSILKRGADFVVLSEGEISTMNLINHIKNNFSLEDVDGIAYKKNGNIIVNSKQELIHNLDDLPFPAWHLFPLKKYFSNQRNTLYGKKYGHFLTIMTRRGCPINCSFCATPAMWRRIYRTRSIENVMKEIRKYVDRYKIKHIQMIDDNFVVNKKRTKRFLKIFISLFPGITIDFSNHLELALLDEELVDLIKKTSKEISFGLESGSQRMLQLIGKPLDLDKDLVIFEKIKETRIKVKAHFIIGFPNETEEDLQQTYNLAKFLKNRYDAYVDFYIFLPLPGSRIFKELDIKLGDNLFDFTFGSVNISVNKNIPLEKLQKLRKEFWEEINFGIKNE